MKDDYSFRCPNCMVQTPIDVAIAHEEARDAVLAAFGLSGKLGWVTLRYLGLFRTGTGRLSFRTITKRLEEITPDIRAGRIDRKGREYPAPTEVWIWAMEKMLEYRDAGRLELPMKNHGYLYEIISGYRKTAMVTASEATGTPRPTGGAPSKTMEGVAALERLRHGR
uniref:Uncharacterized protein n=1 Tax=Candidatus Kentrum sp. LFY TaxID=2126342 RepID=A0A450UE65_9GAMM|nr:MAG: hypothetical protein BECKLFY1418A_GA0070994_101340 [Candidatus Kentron sp. LFY]